MLKMIKLWILISALLFSGGVYLLKTVFDMNMQIASLVAENLSLKKSVNTTRAKTKMRTKAQARMRRILVAIPFVGIGLVGYFEKQDYEEWKAENPEGTFEDYTCEVAEISAELVDDLLQSLPNDVSAKIPQSVVRDLVPACSR